jgi:uncharacterized protein (TIGR02246 family)
MSIRRVALSTCLALAGAAGGLVFVSGSGPIAADDAKANLDQEAVHKVLASMVAGFNKGDAKEAAKSFGEKAEFIDDDGNRVEGPAGIANVLAKFLGDNKDAKLQLTPSGARTVAPGVVMEDGESVVTVAGKGTQSTRRYAMVYAQVNGAWKIASVREFPEDELPVAAVERLKALEWMIGDWIDEGGDSMLTVSCKWSADKSHIIREFSVVRRNKELLKGTQRIGVDPQTNSIKGWAFDSSGGYGESVWTPNGAEWLIRGNSVTGEGDSAAATYILKPINKDRVELKTMHKVVANTVEADMTTILVRKLAK